MPAQKNVNVWKGNTFSLPLRLGTKATPTSVFVPTNLTGSTLVFRAVWDGGSIRKETGEAGFAITNAMGGEATLSLSVAETRQLPQGKVKYEIERQIGGEEKTFLYGELIISEWVNDDG